MTCASRFEAILGSIGETLLNPTSGSLERALIERVYIPKGPPNHRTPKPLNLGKHFGNIFLGVQPTFGYEGDPMRLGEPSLLCGSQPSQIIISCVIILLFMLYHIM